MRIRAVGLLTCAGTLVMAAVAWAAAPQVALDHIVARVDGHIITESDVRQARLLKLVDDTSSDAATERALENRLLMLEEIDRAAPLPPMSEAEVAAYRREWEARVGGAAKAASLLGNATMTEAALDAWLRDDLRIRAYVARQFGSLPDADRAGVMADWIARLRQRAGL